MDHLNGLKSLNERLDKIENLLGSQTPKIELPQYIETLRTQKIKSDLDNNKVKFFDSVQNLIGENTIFELLSRAIDFVESTYKIIIGILTLVKPEISLFKLNYCLDLIHFVASSIFDKFGAPMLTNLINNINEMKKTTHPGKFVELHKYNELAYDYEKTKGDLVRAQILITNMNKTTEQKNRSWLKRR